MVVASALTGVDNLYAWDGEDLVLSMPGLGRAWVAPDGTVRVEASAGSSPDAVAQLTRLAANVARVRRGDHGVRGSAVEVRGRAVVVAGACPVLGRSSVAAALVARGHGLLGDEWVTWDAASVVSGDGHAVALTPGTASRVGLDPDRGVPVRPGSPRRRYELRPGRPAPLALLLVVRRTHVADVTVRAVTGVQAAFAVTSCRAAVPVVEKLRMQERQFAWLTSGLQRAQVLQAEVPRSGWYVDRLVHAVEDAAA